uniref:Uncharacterized protein n=1 Tax=Timema genevievae TaxID=629358 RepID=A0A7R9K2J0_TIMGE|nr:unnamed protein product [Timema genevievae]
MSSPSPIQLKLLTCVIALVMFLVSAAVSCIALYFATSWYLVLLLAFCFVCFIAVSSSLLNSSVVDIFPTSLRQLKKGKVTASVTVSLQHFGIADVAD